MTEPTDPPSPADDLFEPAFVVPDPTEPEPGPEPEPQQQPEPQRQPEPVWAPVPQRQPEPVWAPVPRGADPSGEPAADDEAEVDLVTRPDPHGLGHGVRSVLALAVALVVLGSLVAGLLGGSLLVGYHLLDRALR